MTLHPDGVTLNDFADDALSGSATTEVAAHLASCTQCAATVESLRQIRRRASRLTPLQPRVDTWDRIARTLRSHQRSLAPRRLSPWSWLATAAALVVATIVGLKVADVRRQPATTAVSPADAETPTAQSVEAELSQAQEHYQKAITGLEKIANAEKGSLDPQTASTLEKSLAVVDQAINESRAALKVQPANEPAQESLLENFKTKIALLQDTVALINEMRKGPSDAGAARIVTGVKQKGN